MYFGISHPKEVFTAAHKFAVVSGRPGEHQNTDEERGGAEPGKRMEWGCQDRVGTTRSPPVAPEPRGTRRSSLGSRCPGSIPAMARGWRWAARIHPGLRVLWLTAPCREPEPPRRFL